MTKFPIISNNKLIGVFEKQWLHFLSILVFTIIFYYLSKIGEVTSGYTVFNLSIVFLYWMAYITPIVHQLYVWICWRLQLYYNIINKIFGLKVGFILYAIIFGILFVFRFISVFLLSYANHDSISGLTHVFWLVIIIISPIILYSFYSVKMYFGITRAFGLDHFDPKTHELPLVDKGIYKFVSNGMYWIALLVLFLPGLYYSSFNGLLLAGFNYCYIWVHYYSVEKPDMEKIYSKNKD